MLGTRKRAANGPFSLQYLRAAQAVEWVQVCLLVASVGGDWIAGVGTATEEVEAL